MRTESPALAPFLRSQTQARLLSELLLQPGVKRSVTELTRLVDAPQSVVSKEVGRLVQAGVLVDERVGRTRLVSANPEYRLREPLTQIIAATFGPEPVLTRLLGDIEGIDQAFIYGSWAARFTGTTGRAPGDVDVLVVGAPDRAALNEAVVAAERELGLPVQITRVSRSAWERASEPFIQTVRAKPLIVLRLIGDTP
ncbi:MAG: winged helix-turn-helix domain-containing protein [Propionibacteriaceae bacterium]|jgi:DNA-binding transcriptional ArsR family regulator|nr:winged helix-turn-helix domain-containing protein [Propionibacteriaceae bacterium]